MDCPSLLTSVCLAVWTRFSLRIDIREEKVFHCVREGLAPFSPAVQEAEVRAGRARARADIITLAC